MIRDFHSERRLIRGVGHGPITANLFHSGRPGGEVAFLGVAATTCILVVWVGLGNQGANWALIDLARPAVYSMLGPIADAPPVDLKLGHIWTEKVAEKWRSSAKTHSDFRRKRFWQREPAIGLEPMTC
jgi:hypothetical protein